MKNIIEEYYLRIIGESYFTYGPKVVRFVVRNLGISSGLKIINLKHFLLHVTTTLETQFYRQFAGFAEKN